MPELLISVGVLAVLLSLLLPALGSARQRAQAVACLAQIRQVHIGVQLYADDDRGVVPTFLPDAFREPPHRDAWQGQSNRSLRWAADHIVDGQVDALACPANKLATLQPDLIDPPIDYKLSATLFFDDAFFDPERTDLDQDIINARGRARKLSSVRYPSQKVVVFEDLVWHDYTGGFSESQPISELLYGHDDTRGSAAFGDGSAALTADQDATRPVFRSLGRTPTGTPLAIGGEYNTTANGLAGIDHER